MELKCKFCFIFFVRHSLIQDSVSVFQIPCFSAAQLLQIHLIVFCSLIWMASALGSLAPMEAPFTKEKKNYFRICYLLIDCGTKALRSTFERYFAPASLQGFLARPSVYSTLHQLRGKSLSDVLWSKLYPTPSSSVTLEDLDFGLLMLLLMNTSGLTPPATGWHSLPNPLDQSVEANIARLKYYRNWLYGHTSHSSMDDPTFNAYWKDVSSALMGLGVDAHTIFKLRSLNSAEQDCKRLKEEFRKEEDNIRNNISAVKGRKKCYQASC